MKTIFIFSFGIFIVLFSKAQTVNIPDANFKSALLAHDPVIDTNADGEIQISEAIAFDGTMNVQDKSISDLTGIEAFINITQLYCAENNLTELDLSANLFLQKLSAWSNQLTNIDISQNTALTNLELSTNNLTNLDVSHNINLDYLGIGYNGISELNVSNNVNLTQISIQGNSFVSLDFSDNPLLQFVGISGAPIVFLNLQNGNNASLSNLYLSDVPDLQCVRVDRETVGNIPEDWNYPEGTNFSDECTMMSVANNTIQDLKIYPNPAEDMVFIQSKEAIQSVQISNLSGQVVFTKNQQKITSVNVSQLSAGVYILTAETEFGKTINQKLIIK